MKKISDFRIEEYLKQVERNEKYLKLDIKQKESFELILVNYNRYEAYLEAAKDLEVITFEEYEVYRDSLKNIYHDEYLFKRLGLVKWKLQEVF